MATASTPGPPIRDRLQRRSGEFLSEDSGAQIKPGDHEQQRRQQPDPAKYDNGLESVDVTIGS
jgi:hypothetical protein